MLIRVVVRIASNAVVCGSAVELWVEQCLPTAIVEAAGKNRIHSPVFAAIRNPPFVGFEACRFKRKFPAIQLLCLAGNHIYDRKEGAGPVQRRTGTADHFHSFNQVHVQRELCSQHGLFVNIVVDSVAVDQQEHPAVIRFRAVNASHPGIDKVAVVGDIETAHATRNVSKGAVTVFLDLVSGDYCDRGGSVGDLLYMSRCARGSGFAAMDAGISRITMDISFSGGARSFKLCRAWTRPHMFFRPDSGSALEESEIRVSVQAGKSDLLRKWKAGFST